MVSEHYTEYRKWIMASDHIDNVKKYFVQHLNSVEKFMLSEDYSEEWLGEFVAITNKLDTIRKQNVLDIVPQFESLFNDAHNE